ncbi:MAG: L,D-transpeptidase [Armatimonadetes bacterium]|nr:L,D-transpeptidase [Armatimonadota bacterium]
MMGIRRWGARWLAALAAAVSIAAHAPVTALAQEPAAPAAARIVINVPSRTLTLYAGDRVSRVYPVGVGQRRWPTPLGRWRILEKVVNPTWGYPYNDYKGSLPVIPPGPRNPLGTRWMGFTPEEHGIHGTNQPGTVGKVVSHGCVRMRMKDAEELFELVAVGTPVEVRHDTVRVKVDAGRGWIWAAAYPDVYGKGRASRARLNAEVRRQGIRAALSEGAVRRLLARRDGRFYVVGRLAAPDQARSSH